MLQELFSKTLTSIMERFSKNVHTFHKLNQRRCLKARTVAVFVYDSSFSMQALPCPAAHLRNLNAKLKLRESLKNTHMLHALRQL